MAQKEFKTLSEQISLLRQRGLAIADEKCAKQFLYFNNYYRISGYSLTLRNHDIFSKSASFQQIIDIYNFDHEFRHILLKYIEMIEIKFKSAYVYEFTKEYGPTGYLDVSHFTDSKRHTAILQKAEAQKEKRLPNEAFLKHYVEELKENLPLWAYIDLLTISDISFLYSISDHKIKTAVANSFGITKKGAALLGKFMHSMTIIRNLCAHGSRLYNRLFEQKPSLSRSELALLRKNSDGAVDNAHLFGFILIMKRLLANFEFCDFKDELLLLTQKIPFVQMKYYGFPSDWQNLI